MMRWLFRPRRANRATALVLRTAVGLAAALLAGAAFPGSPATPAQADG